jgi:hypothetical protein
VDESLHGLDEPLGRDIVRVAPEDAGDAVQVLHLPYLLDDR